MELQRWNVAFLLMTVRFLHMKAANILGVFPVGAKSHFAFNESIMKSLHAAGHEITIICPVFKGTQTIKNFTVISIPFGSLDSTTRGSITDFVKLPLYNYLKNGFTIMENYCDNFLTSDYVQNILNSSETKFDILIAEYLQYNCFTIIAEKFDIPIIVTNAIQSALHVDWLLGSPNNPAVIPVGFSYIPRQMNFYQRLENFGYYLYFQFLLKIMLPSKVTEMRGRFGENFKHIPEKKVSLVFQNIHSSLLARPLVENVIEVGGIRVKPINTLPLDIQKFIDESTGGVVLFTFGSIARGTFLSPSSVNAFKQVFAQIPQRVIWKYEDIIEDLPKNVMISDWIPQRHILAHENVVAFITHCGLSGIYEAIHSSVPLVMIPFYGDQLPNAAALEGLGVGVHLDPLTLSKETIRDALDSIVNDTSYRENMRNLSRRFKDRPMTPQESVVYWTEHVISHNGAPHLRTNLSDMPMYQYLCLDIFLVSSALLLIILLFVRQLERVYLEQSVPQSGKKKRN